MNGSGIGITVVLDSNSFLNNCFGFDSKSILLISNSVPKLDPP